MVGAWRVSPDRRLHRPARRLPRHAGARWAALLILIALGLGLARPAAAQSGVVLDALTIELWPEYDQPSMLVILRVTLAPATTLPASITLHLPAASKGPSAVAMQDASGQLLTAPYITAAAGDRLAVQLQATSASFQVEYYDPTLKISGEQRDFTFQWQADYPASAATLLVQEPAGARDLKGDPALSLVGSGGQGLNDYTASLGALTAGQTVSLHLSYAKSTAALSKQTVSLAATAPVAAALGAAGAPAAATANTSPGLMLGAAGLLALVSLAGLGTWVQRRRRPAPAEPGSVPAVPPNGPTSPASSRAPAPRSPTPHSPAPHSPAPLPAGPVAARFCTQCGRPAAADDRFCRGCGTPLRFAPGEPAPK